MKNRIKVKFTDFWEGFNYGENWYTSLINKTEKYEAIISDNPDVLFYSVFGREFMKFSCKRILYTAENTRPNFKYCDYAFSFDHIDSARNYRLPYYRKRFDETVLTQDRSAINKDPANRKFCSFIVSNGNVEFRTRFFEELSKYKKVDSGGRFMNNIGGPVDDKLSFISSYKFNIAFENSSYPGYTTEKLIEAWLTGTIPIYWGNPQINEEINPACFIHVRGEDDFESAIERIIEIDNNDDLFKAYLSEPLFKNNILPEFLSEKAIVDAFERFLDASIEIPTARKKLDRLKYYYLNLFHPA